MLNHSSNTVPFYCDYIFCGKQTFFDEGGVNEPATSGFFSPGCARITASLRLPKTRAPRYARWPCALALRAKKGRSPAGSALLYLWQKQTSCFRFLQTSA